MAATVPSSSSHTFAPQTLQHSSPPSSSSAPRNSRTILSDTTEQPFGNPNALPGPPPSHFFPSVPRAQREKARQARLEAAAAGSSSPPLPDGAPAKGELARRAQGEAGAGPSDDERQQLQPRTDFASSGPSDDRRPSVDSGAGVGRGAGTKRRFRDVERTSWDAASELVRIEREKEMMVLDGVEGGKGMEVVRDPEDREKTPTPSMAQSVSMAAANDRSGLREAASMSASPDTEPAKRFSIASIVSDDVDAERHDAMAVDDDASVVTGASGTSANGESGAASDGSAKEPAKKRSRTLTTPAQTAVLNALLAKTRFPSTEVREEVGKQIGMSARRVQVWFQNRRQSQKRQRDREAQEAAAASAAAASAMSTAAHPSMLHPGYPHMHPHAYPPLAYGQPLPAYSGMQADKPLPPHPGTVYTGRPDFHRHSSMDSVGSQQSYASSRLSMGSSYHTPAALQSRESLSYFPSEARFSHPYAGGVPSYTFGRPPHPGSAPTGLLIQPPQHAYPLAQGGAAPFPTKLYFPHVPRSHVPPGTVQADAPASATSGSPTDVKLPSLSSVLGAGPAAPSTQQPPPPAAPAASSAPVDHQPMFSHSPFSPTPSHASVASPISAPLANPSLQRAVFSPEPPSSFERLRISGGPLSPTMPTPYSPASTAATSSTAVTVPVHPARRSSADILDAAMETMAYRPSGRSLPPRQTLPPLRSVFGDAPGASRGGKKGGHSEADKALLAPIKTDATAAPAAGPPRLPPIQSFAPSGLATDSSSTSSSASPPETTSRPNIRDSRASTLSEASYATRSSLASFDFGKPPAGSYRASTSSERDVLAEDRGREERDGSVGTEETSASAAEGEVAK